MYLHISHCIKCYFYVMCYMMLYVIRFYGIAVITCIRHIPTKTKNNLGAILPKSPLPFLI